MKTKNEILDTVKDISTFVTSVGVTVVVFDVIKYTGPVGAGLIRRIFTTAGGGAIAGLLSKHTDAYVKETIDDISKSVEVEVKEFEPAEDVQEIEAEVVS